MIRLCACVIAATGAFFLNEAIGQAPAGVALREKAAGQTSPNTEQPPATPEEASARQPPPGGNPLWGIPISALDATRERPIFSASRRPPMLPVVAERVTAPPPPKPAEPEHPLLTLVGTAIGTPKNIAVVLDRATKTLVRVHVGEAVSGWVLRSVDSRTMTVEKNSQTETLALPEPGSVPVNPLPVSEASSGIAREF
jgi:general secretion pathway protein N